MGYDIQTYSNILRCKRLQLHIKRLTRCDTIMRGEPLTDHNGTDRSVLVQCTQNSKIIHYSQQRILLGLLLQTTTTPIATTTKHNLKKNHHPIIYQQ